jgi:large repetitive protein
LIRYLAATCLVALATAIPLAGAAFDPATPQIVSSTPSSPASDNTPTLNGTADPGSLITVYTDSSCLLGVVGTGTADGSGDFHVAVTVPVPSDATTTFYATAADLTPAVSPCSGGFPYVEDSTAPDTTIGGSPPSLTDATASFSFSGSDGSGSGVASFQCALDGGAFSACTSPKSYTLPSGSHTFAVRALDQAGNVDPSPDSVSWTVDADAPDTTIQGSPPPFTDATASFAFAGDDGGGSGVAGFQCKLDAGDFAACTSPENFSGLAAGSHTFAVRAVDQAGNLDPTPDTFTWTVDATAPDTTISSGPTDPTASTSAIFAFTGDDGSGSGVAGFRCSLDGSGFTACTSPASYSGLGDGPHTFAVRAVDQAGNVDPSPDSLNWTVDATPPDTTIAGSPPPLTDATASFSFTGDDGGGSGVAGFQCKLDAGAFSACTSPQGYTLASGAHTFSVRAVDQAGNVDPSPDTFTWTVDATPPDTTIAGSPPPLTDATASFSFSGSDGSGSGVASFQCALDGGAFSACTSPKSYTLASGSHTFAVRAVDQAGNVDPSADSFTWTVDATPPDTTIAGSPPPLTDATASFSFSGSDGSGSGVASFQCALDGGAFSACTSPKSYTLASGSHTFAVRAIDQAGNVDPSPDTFTWTVDANPPDTTISSNPPNPSPSASASFGFNGSDPGGSVASFQCKLDGAGFSACTSPKSYSGLADGQHTFSVRAVDQAGNVDPSPDAFNWTIDTTIPTTTITSSPGDASNDTSPTFAFTSSANGAIFTCGLDGAAFSSCTSPKTYSALGDGTHTFQVKSKNAAGSESPPATRSWLIDTVAPNTSIGSHPADPSAQTSASFAFTGSDDSSQVASFQCKLDGGAFTACASPKAYSNLANGSHTFSVRAVDHAGNIDASPDSFTWLVDTVPPRTTIDTSPANPSNSASASFQFSGDDGSGSGLAGFQCALDSGAFSACPSPKSYSSLSDGPHTFKVRAVDHAGNVDPTPDSYTWVVDTIAPQTTIGTHPASLTSATNASFSFTGTDAGSGVAGFDCALDGGVFSTCTAPKSYSGLSDGSHTFTVRATDVAGNVDQSPASFTWVVDTVAPDTTITSPAPSLNSTAATFTFTASESATFQCKLDGAAFAACTSPEEYFGLASGPHTFAVRGIDGAGNIDASPASVSWSIDTDQPVISISSAHPDPTNATDASFSFAANKQVSGFQCKLDDGAFAPCSSPQGYSDLAAGDHVFAVEATDLSGNQGSASFDWTIDLVPPTVAITGTPSSLTNNPSPSFTFTANEAGSTFQCKLDDGAFAACSSPQAYSGLASSAHTFTVRSIDLAGNVSPAPASYTWTVDTIPPQTALLGFPPGQSSSRSATFGFTGSDASGVTGFQCSLDSAPFGACVNPTTYTSLSDGAHSFRVRAIDAAGNIDPAPATYAWTIDATPPPPPIITAAPSTPNGTSGATFTFSDAEPGAALLCRIDGGAAAGCPSGSVTYSGLADGSHTFRVTARDALGNQSAPAAYTWTIDTVHPLVTITDKPPLLTNRTSVTFAFAANRAGSTYECRLDGGSFAACGSPQLYRALADGSHTFSVRATSLGNIGLATAYTWKIDTVAPETTVTSGPPPNSHTASPRFTFTSSEPQSTFACALDSGGYAPCTSPKTFARLADGAHTLHVEAVDAAGNADSSPATWGWKITGGGGVVDLPPANVSRLKPTVGYGLLRLRWKSPADADFDHIGVYVSTSAKSPPRTLLYKGRAQSYTIKKFKNGLYYRYLVVSYDHAENASRGASVVVPTGALLRSPLEGRAVRSVPTFRWAAVPKASFYNVQVYSRGRKILSAWPTKPRQAITRSWTYAGRRFSFRKGVYVWYVWPGFGPKAKSHYGQLLGQGTFRVR